MSVSVSFSPVPFIPVSLDLIAASLQRPSQCWIFFYSQMTAFE